MKFVTVLRKKYLFHFQSKICIRLLKPNSTGSNVDFIEIGILQWIFDFARPLAQSRISLLTTLFYNTIYNFKIICRVLCTHTFKFFGRGRLVRNRSLRRGRNSGRISEKQGDVQRGPHFKLTVIVYQNMKFANKPETHCAHQ